MLVLNYHHGAYAYWASHYVLDDLNAIVSQATNFQAIESTNIIDSKSFKSTRTVLNLRNQFS